MEGNFLIVLMLTVLASIIGIGSAQFDPHFVGNRTVMVHLFEWRWNDIAEECERFLAPYGYAGVQVSPPNENVIINQSKEKRPWWERYQTVSYKLETRSGTEQEFQSMVRRCNTAGVRVYVDTIANHMTGPAGQGTGTAGSYYDADTLDFPAVPYSSSDFNGPNTCHSTSGDIENYTDPSQLRNCRLVGLKDLDQGKEWVRDRLMDFLNKLTSYGVAGFRMDAAKHMWPEDLRIMLGRLNSLPTDHGFPSGAKPFVFQEVIDFGEDSIPASQYTGHGRVTEFKAAANIAEVIRKNDNQQLKYLRNWGEGWGFNPEGKAVVFVDNHDNQRAAGNILTFRVPRMYKMAQAFFLAWPYGVTRVMSSFYWEQDFQNGRDENDWTGPPHDENFNILPVAMNQDLSCGNGWVCEHRWREIFNMARFRNVVQGTGVEGWWDNQSNQIAFSRGNRGFIAINNDNFDMDGTFNTGLPGGIYCDVISGNLYEGTCTGKFIPVGDDGSAQIYISSADEDPIVAIHVEARL